MNKKNDLLLAGDIGATKTTLALFSHESCRNTLLEKTFPSTHYDSLTTIIAEFLSDIKYNVNKACFGVAGPVIQGSSTITNLPWIINEINLRTKFSFKSVKLLNDLVSVANFVPLLKKSDLYTINKGIKVDDGAIAVIAPGTGLGEAYLTYGDNSYHAHASEGGHTDFAPTNYLQSSLLYYLQTKLGGRVSYERVCSGMGLTNIYHYLKDIGYADEPDWLTYKLSKTDDINPSIISAALNPKTDCRLCSAAVNLFISILGAESSNMALKVMANGGVYLGGGIPPRILSLLKTGLFMKSFTDKGRFTSMLTKVPVYVILNPKTALFGAAAFGLNHL